MRRATLKNINAQIAVEFPDLCVKMFKGNGYFYFSGGHEVPSIYVFALSQMTFDEWMEHVRVCVKDSQTYRYTSRITSL